MRARYLQPCIKRKQPVAQHAAVMHHVVNKQCASALQGYGKTRNATLYAVFSTSTAAYAHIKANKMQLYACVVSM